MAGCSSGIIELRGTCRSEEGFVENGCFHPKQKAALLIGRPSTKGDLGFGSGIARIAILEFLLRLAQAGKGAAGEGASPMGAACPGAACVRAGRVRTGHVRAGGMRAGRVRTGGMRTGGMRTGRVRAGEMGGLDRLGAGMSA